MPAQVGATVSISPYDYGKEDGPEPGDVLVTYSERTQAYGTVYRVVSSRLMRSAKPGRYSLRCEVLGRYDDVWTAEAIGPTARPFGIVWSSRKRRRPR